MSSSPMRAWQSSPQSRQRQSSRSSSRPQPMRSELASSPVSRDPVETLLACRCSRPMLLASVSHCCARLSLDFAIWRFWPMSVPPGSVLEMGEVQAAARALGLEATTLEIRRAEDIVPSFETLKNRAEALYVCTDPLVITNRARIHTLAMGARLPTIYNSREYVETGGLMSYGPNWVDRWKRTAEIVDKILRGTKPADIPVEQPTKFDLVINLTTAKVLGLEVPDKLLVTADEVIE